MTDETIYNEEVYHTGNGQETPSNPDYMDPETGEAVPYEAGKIPQEKVVSEYLKKCNLNYSDEEEKNNHVNYDCFNT
ncbi:MAG: hypothetical protein ACLFM7_10010 [Bacteroidales bacterium]